MWKNYFYFTRTEKRGIILLSVLIVILVIIRCLPETPAGKPETEDDFEKEYTDFIATIREKEFPVNRNYNEPATTVQLTSFDPNTADSLTFTRLGLKPWIAGNIIRYRGKGGKFRKPEDFRKIYGLTDETFEELLPYISIEKEIIPQRDTIPSAVIAEKRDTFPRIFKYPAGTVINLNEADTTELKKIPGIGSYTARQITDYRRRLGGFYNVSQLQEINLDTEKFAGWFTVGDYLITRININRVSIDRLRNHPYFNFYQSKAIVELRKKKGSLKSLDELALLEEFTEKDFDRMKHYVSFE